MHLKEAVDLIRHNSISGSVVQTWTDLGCGSGTFTAALANLLPAGSLIYAVDKSKSSLEKIPEEINDVKVNKLKEDFTKGKIPGSLDGILMANSLHYVRDKSSFIKKIKTNLKPGGFFLIIEYDSMSSNPWVPYPVNFNSLKILFESEGCCSIIKINERPSVFRRANIYSSLIKI